MKTEHQKKHADWQQLVEEQQNSGLSQKVFCEQKSIILSKFGYYRSILKNDGAKSTIKPTSFVPVKISTKEHTVPSSEIKLSLPNGFQCTFQSTIDPAQIKRFVEVLLSC